MIPTTIESLPPLLFTGRKPSTGGLGSALPPNILEKYPKFAKMLEVIDLHNSPDSEITPRNVNIATDPFVIVLEDLQTAQQGLEELIERADASPAQLTELKSYWEPEEALFERLNSSLAAIRQSTEMRVTLLGQRLLDPTTPKKLEIQLDTLTFLIHFVNLVLLPQNRISKTYADNAFSGYTIPNQIPKYVFQLAALLGPKLPKNLLDQLKARIESNQIEYSDDLAYFLFVPELIPLLAGRPNQRGLINRFTSCIRPGSRVSPKAGRINRLLEIMPNLARGLLSLNEDQKWPRKLLKYFDVKVLQPHLRLGQYPMSRAGLEKALCTKLKIEDLRRLINPSTNQIYYYDDYYEELLDYINDVKNRKNFIENRLRKLNINKCFPCEPLVKTLLFQAFLKSLAEDKNLELFIFKLFVNLFTENPPSNNGLQSRSETQTNQLFDFFTQPILNHPEGICLLEDETTWKLFLKLLLEELPQEIAPQVISLMTAIIKDPHVFEIFCRQLKKITSVTPPQKATILNRLKTKHLMTLLKVPDLNPDLEREIFKSIFKKSIAAYPDDPRQTLNQIEEIIQNKAKIKNKDPDEAVKKFYEITHFPNDTIKSLLAMSLEERIAIIQAGEIWQHPNGGFTILFLICLMPKEEIIHFLNSLSLTQGPKKEGYIFTEAKSLCLLIEKKLTKEQIGDPNLKLFWNKLFRDWTSLDPNSDNKRYNHFVDTELGTNILSHFDASTWLALNSMNFPLKRVSKHIAKLPPTELAKVLYKLSGISFLLINLICACSPEKLANALNIPICVAEALIKVCAMNDSKNSPSELPEEYKKLESRENCEKFADILLDLELDLEYSCPILKVGYLYKYIQSADSIYRPLFALAVIWREEYYLIWDFRNSFSKLGKLPGMAEDLLQRLRIVKYHQRNFEFSGLRILIALKASKLITKEQFNKTLSLYIPNLLAPESNKGTPPNRIPLLSLRNDYITHILPCLTIHQTFFLKQFINAVTPRPINSVTSWLLDENSFILDWCEKRISNLTPQDWKNYILNEPGYLENPQNLITALEKIPPTDLVKGLCDRKNKPEAPIHTPAVWEVLLNRPDFFSHLSSDMLRLLFTTLDSNGTLPADHPENAKSIGALLAHPQISKSFKKEERAAILQHCLLAKTPTAPPTSIDSDLMSIIGREGRTAGELIAIEVSEHWLKAPKTTQVIACYDDSTYVEHVDALEKKVVQILEASELKNDRALSFPTAFGVSPYSHFCMALKNTIFKLMREKTRTKVLKNLPPDQLTFFYCKMLSNFENIIVLLEQINDPTQSRQTLFSIARSTPDIDQICITGTSDVIDFELEVTLPALINKNAPRQSTPDDEIAKAATYALRLCVEAESQQKTSAYTHRHTSLLAVAGFPVPMDTHGIPLETALQELKNTWQIPNILKYFRTTWNKIDPEVRFDWLKTQMPERLLKENLAYEPLRTQENEALDTLRGEAERVIAPEHVERLLSFVTTKRESKKPLDFIKELDPDINTDAFLCHIELYDETIEAIAKAHNIYFKPRYHDTPSKEFEEELRKLFVLGLYNQNFLKSVSLEEIQETPGQDISNIMLATILEKLGVLRKRNQT